ncbi:hypothetical protein FACS1894202_09930 [Clostridia bacterium]|nr:hypothetical protein FACS1894202_09930 [Clostridia bacterium]
MKKVLHLISGGDVGGAKTAVLSLLRGLAEAGNTRATLVCFRDGPFADEARSLGIDTRVIHGNGVGGDVSALVSLVRAGKYDLLHSHGSRGNTMAAMTKMLTGLPTITTIHSDYKLDYLGSPLRGLFYGNVNRWALRRLDNIVCVSDAMTDLMIGRGFRPSRTYTIYNGLDFNLELPTVSKRSILQSFGVNYRRGDVVVGCAARMDKVKDLGTLLTAIALAAANCPNLKLVFFGDGGQKASLEKLSIELKIRDRVTFAGWQPDPDRFFQALDINVLTSLHETFGYVLVEGSRAKLATVATNVGGVPSIIDHGVNGLMFEPRDAETLAEYLKTLYDDPELRKTYGEALEKKCRREFSLERTIQTQERIYDAVSAAAARRKGSKRDGVTICGAYGYRNAGDEAILGAILGRLRSIDPLMPITLLSRSPRQTAIDFREDTQHTFDVFKLSRAFKGSKLYINGGGNLIQDATSSRSLWFYLFTLWLAKKRGAKTLMYACGIGPVRRPMNKKLAARILGGCADGITMREDLTQRELDALGVKIANARLTADSALALAPASKETIDAACAELGLDPGTTYLCLSVRKWDGLKQAAPAFAAVMDAAWKEFGMTTLILPFELRHDPEAAADILALTDAPRVIAVKSYRPEVLIGIMARMRAVVAMRLHALIFAAGQGVPLVGVSYDVKAMAFLKYLGQDLCCMLSDCSPDTLTALLRECMAREDNKQARLDAVERLRVLERGNLEVLTEFLN